MKVMVKRLCQIHPQILSSVCLRQSSCLIYPKISPTSSQPSAPDLQSQSVLAALLLMKTITDVLKAPCCHNDCTSNSLNNKLRCSVDYLTASTIHHISVIANKVNLCYSTTQGCTIRHRSSPILLLQKSPNTFYLTGLLVHLKTTSLIKCQVTSCEVTHWFISYFIFLTETLLDQTAATV